MYIPVAEVQKMPITTIAMSYAVRIVSPVEMPPRIYKVTIQELMMKGMSSKSFTQDECVFNVLQDKVIADYNKYIEECAPLMDMLDNPLKYQTCTYIEFILID